VRLWAHETLRVFHDRLVDDNDRDWFCGMLAGMLPKHLGMQFGDVFQVDAAAAATADAAALATADAEQARQAAAAVALRGVLFADFLQPGGAEAAKYQEATDTGKLLKAVEDALADYNAQVGFLLVLWRCCCCCCCCWLVYWLMCNDIFRYNFVHDGGCIRLHVPHIACC
jgi:dynein heavy chain